MARVGEHRDASFRGRLADTLTDARTVLGGENTTFAGLGYSPVVTALDDAVAKISSELAVSRVKPTRMRELGALLHQVDGTRRELHEHRLRSYAQIDAELDSLQHSQSLKELLEKAPTALTRCCGVDESGLWSIRDGNVALISLHCSDDSNRATEIKEALSPIPLHAQLLETEVIRRRAGVLVLNARSDPRVDRVTDDRFGADAHVTVPIMPEGKVVGFFHGGCYPGNRLVDAFDFDAVGMFARGFGRVLERVVLRTRISQQREYFERMVVSEADFAARLADSKIALDDGGNVVPEGRVPPPLPPEARIRSLLTARELEVLELMAAGRTNREIATEFVVSVGTVKFHVKHILSKLNATNRAQAVSRYMRIAVAQRASF